MSTFNSLVYRFDVFLIMLVAIPGAFICSSHVHIVFKSGAFTYDAAKERGPGSRLETSATK